MLAPCVQYVAIYVYVCMCVYVCVCVCIYMHVYVSMCVCMCVCVCVCIYMHVEVCIYLYANGEPPTMAAAHVSAHFLRGRRRGCARVLLTLGGLSAAMAACARSGFR